MAPPTSTGSRRTTQIFYASTLYGTATLADKDGQPVNAENNWQNTSSST